MIALFAAASIASMVPGVPDMVTADICLSAMGGRASPVFSQETFDNRARTYKLTHEEMRDEQVFCREYVRTIKLLATTNQH
jgi:hypothetical protein